MNLEQALLRMSDLSCELNSLKDNFQDEIVKNAEAYFDDYYGKKSTRSYFTFNKLYVERFLF